MNYNCLLSFITLTLLFSFYSYDYKWNLWGTNLLYNINKIESNMLYFIGFGIPYSIIILLFISESFVITLGIFNLIFPFTLIQSIGKLLL